MTIVTMTADSQARDKTEPQDLYLEEVWGDQAIDWVKTHNQSSSSHFRADPRFEGLRKTTLELMNAKDRLLGISVRDGWVSNFWQDADHRRGIVRRMPLDRYLAGDRDWQTVLDIDAIAAAENENWAYKGAVIFQDRMLVELSRGGKDAIVLREFDLNALSFVKDGFNVNAEGRHDAAWLDRDTLVIGYATESEEDVTVSGYARKVRIWKRGQNIDEAQVIFVGERNHVGVWSYIARDDEDAPGGLQFIIDATEIDRYSIYFVSPTGIKKLDVPSTSGIYVNNGKLYVQTKEDWKYQGSVIPLGSLVRFDFTQFMSGLAQAQLLFVQSATKFLDSYSVINERIFATVREHVSTKLVELIFSGNTVSERSFSAPPHSTVSVDAVSNKDTFLSAMVMGFLTPPTRYKLNFQSGELEKIEAGPERFDPRPFKVEQHFATSLDGTRVPYYLIGRKDIEFNGKNPTLLYAYGGFGISMSPRYSGIVGKNWLERGGVYVLANIRGGSEYGPNWHLSVLKENRHKVFEDFFAVAEDLIDRRVTSPRHLGIQGGSNGGLLMGVAMTKRPDLFRAVVVEVPLLDMLRFHMLLAGASWMGEYGNPEVPEERAVLEAYSPYQNVRSGVGYPEAYFFTSTADDRVHPGHARRMAAKMESLGYKIFYYENMEGGHGGSINNESAAENTAYTYVYLLQKLF